MSVQDVVLSKPSEKVKALNASVQEAAKELLREMQVGKSETLLRYLECCAKFHQYSFHNILLALSQRSNLTRLAGMRRWNDLGRYVKRGEKGIAILAPMRVGRRHADTPNGDDRERLESFLIFKIVHVFDVSQTEGKPLPEVIRARGEVSTLYPALEALVRSEGITLDIEDSVPGSFGALGVSLKGRIVVRRDLAPADAFRTLVHEYAHELLHWRADREDKAIRETEADATAFIVCRRFGIECDTADYLQLHEATPQLLLNRLEIVRHTAGRIIEALESRVQALPAP
ncbi:MAG: DUF1738 domain-containing protein [Candidatus Omnitrophica bacterium]|nr:hypothetical protein [bacterium]NUN97423.1 DUF1738 domain-containing protein [Candidatus Omnitrophota bacterium]